MVNRRRINNKIVAIIRGVRPEDVIDVGRVLIEAGISAIEVPLNSPDPFSSIEMLASAYGKDALIGAGTVLTTDHVEKVHAAGGRLVVSPNTDIAVIGKTKELDMISLPGFATATEAFTAIAAGADGLKLFPAGVAGVATVAALKAVLPPDIPVFAVGGVGSQNMRAFVDAGADGFGLGSNLYRPSMSLQDIADNAKAAVAASLEAFE